MIFIFRKRYETVHAESSSVLPALEVYSSEESTDCEGVCSGDDKSFIRERLPLCAEVATVPPLLLLAEDLMEHDVLLRKLIFAGDEGVRE